MDKAAAAGWVPFRRVEPVAGESGRHRSGRGRESPKPLKRVAGESGRHRSGGRRESPKSLEYVAGESGRHRSGRGRESPKSLEYVAGESGRHRSGRRGDASTLLGPVAFGCGLISLAPLPPAVRAALLGVFILIGPGMAVAARLKLPLFASLAAVPTVGLATVAGLTSVLVWFHRWPGVELQLILVGAVGLSFLWRPAGLAAMPRPDVAHVQRGSSKLAGGWRAMIRNPALILLTVALATWALILPKLRNVQYSQFGLLFVGFGPVLVACTVMVVVAFVIALRQGRLGTAALAIGVAIVVQRLTVSLITEVPIYIWTYKHIGVVEYIDRFRDLPPGTDIYGQWPSFFTTFSWFGTVTGLDPVAIAHVFAPIVHVLIAVLVAVIARLVGLDLRTALTAAMLAELVNWVGQDYFAPQAMALVVALGVIALLIASRTVSSAGYLSIPIFAALVPLHQLTPYWVCGVAVVFAVTRRLRPWWLPISFLALLIAYLIPRLATVAPYGILSGFNPVDNAQSNVGFEGSFGKVFTSLVCRSLSAAVVLLAVFCAVLWWRQKKPWLIAAVMAFSSFVLLLSQSYGGEAIFRVYLFAVPGCAILIAPLWERAISIRAPRALASRSVLVGTTAAVGLAASAGLQGYYGLWSLVVEYRSQVVWGNELVASERVPVKIFKMYPAGLITRATADYVRYTYQDNDFDPSLAETTPELRKRFPSGDQLADLTEEAVASGGNTYIVFDRQATLAIEEYYGYVSPGSIRQFEDQVRSSPAWKLFKANDLTTIFKFDPAAAVLPAP